MAKSSRALPPAFVARAAAVKAAHAHLSAHQPGFKNLSPRERIAATQAHVTKGKPAR